MKEIPNFEGYFADKDGQIFCNLKSSRNYNAELREVLPRNNGRSYMQVHLCKEGKKYNRYVHRLVYSAYYGEISRNIQVDHINGDKTDNRLENLRLCSCRKNCQFQNKKINSASGEHNIYFDKNKKKYRVTFSINGRNKHFGAFKNLSDAILKRDEINLKIGEFN